MIVDTHSHLNFQAFKKDLPEVIKRTKAAGIVCINVGTKYETSKSAVQIAEENDGMYAAVGLHPIYAAAEFVKTKTDPDEGEFLITEQEFDYEKYKELALSKKVVAIGEIGLDYYYKPKTTAKLADFKAKQKKVLQQQLDLAKEFNLPIIFHCRVAHGDLIELIKGQNLRGVIHCFTGNLEEARQYMDLGFSLGINGIIYKFNIDEVIKEAPIDKLLIETDCPYLTPKPEGDKRNEPLFIKHTIQRIAELKGVSFEEVEKQTTENAKNLFRI